MVNTVKDIKKHKNFRGQSLLPLVKHLEQQSTLPIIKLDENACKACRKNNEKQMKLEAELGKEGL